MLCSTAWARRVTVVVARAATSAAAESSSSSSSRAVAARRSMEAAYCHWPAAASFATVPIVGGGKEDRCHGHRRQRRRWDNSRTTSCLSSPSALTRRNGALSLHHLAPHRDECDYGVGAAPSPPRFRRRIYESGGGEKGDGGRPSVRATQNACRCNAASPTAAVGPRRRHHSRPQQHPPSPLRFLLRRHLSSDGGPDPRPKPQQQKNATPPLSKNQKRRRAKERRKLESQRAKARNRARSRIKKLKRLKNLHVRGKWTRIVSQCHYWFSEANLRIDELLRNRIKENHGWISVEWLLTFPKFHHWTDAALVVEALSRCPGGAYEVGMPDDGDETTTTTVVAEKDHDDSGEDSSSSGDDEEDDGEWDDDSDSDDDEWDSSVDTDDEADSSNAYEDDKDEDDIEEEESDKHDTSSATTIAIDPEKAYIRRKGAVKLVERIENELSSNLPLQCGVDDDGTTNEKDSASDDITIDERGKRRRPMTKKPKWSHLEKYSLSPDRNVTVIKHPDQLAALCDDLRASVSASVERYGGYGDDDDDDDDNGLLRRRNRASAIGFDVEYARLGDDLRALPAMVQLAAPPVGGKDDDDGRGRPVVGLIWLDKFPDCGRDALLLPPRGGGGDGSGSGGTTKGGKSPK